MASPSKRVKVLHSESENFKRYLSGLPPKAWARPSACERWTVADVIAHLSSALEMYTRNLTRGLEGDASPPPGRPAPHTWATALAAERTLRAEDAAQRVITYRESLGDHLLPTLHLAIDGFNQLLASLGAQDWDKRCYHPRGEIPAQNLVTYAILEVCLHQWDIQSKLEADAHLSAEGVRSLIEHIQEYMHWAFGIDADFAEPRRYRFQLTGAVSDEKDLVIDGQQARLASTDSPAVDAVFRCDAENFLLLMCGRIKFSDAVAGGLLVPEDSGELPGEFVRWSQAI
jgi:uncharacterized protein (TIGR03083 family)